MKKNYLIEPSDIKRIRKMIRLIEKAVVEIILLKELRPPETNNFAPAQTDVIEESYFVERQLELFQYAKNDSESF